MSSTLLMDFRLWTPTTFCWYKVTGKIFSSMVKTFIHAPGPICHWCLLPPINFLTSSHKIPHRGRSLKDSSTVHENEWAATWERTHVPASVCSMKLTSLARENGKTETLPQSSVHQQLQQVPAHCNPRAFMAHQNRNKTLLPKMLSQG